MSGARRASCFFFLRRSRADDDDSSWCRFRVPPRRVWEREGTKGLLAWLRARVVG